MAEETSTKTTTRPDGLTDAHLTYLDSLRSSGVVNMFGAGEYLQNRFGLGRGQAKIYLLYWMETFGKPDR